LWVGVEGNAPNAERRAELMYVLIGLNVYFGAFPYFGKANSIFDIKRLFAIWTSVWVTVVFVAWQTFNNVERV